MQLSVLHEDNHLLVINKPPGLATMGVASNRPSLLRQAKAYLKRKYQKPGNVFLGVVSRLDLPVSGVVVLARTSKAAARLTNQFRLRQVEKTYLAMVERFPAEREGHWVDWMERDESTRRMRVWTAPRPGAREATMSYRVIASRETMSLLELKLETGRRHQLRAQLAAHQCAICGDRRYGAVTTWPAGIALHARAASLQHPTRHETLTFTAPVPSCWLALAWKCLHAYG